MAKLIVVCLVYFVAFALTFCSASRPLVAASSPDLTHSTTRRAPSLSDSVKSEVSSTSTESQNVPAELDGELTESDSEEFVYDFHSCIRGEEDAEPCRRMLKGDYGPPTSNPDVKHR